MTASTSCTDADWDMVSNEALVDELIELWKIPSLPAVVMGSPGVGKSLGTVSFRRRTFLSFFLVNDFWNFRRFYFLVPHLGVQKVEPIS